MRPARAAGNYAVLVVPIVKVKMEAQHSIPPLSLHDLLRESFTFTFTSTFTFIFTFTFTFNTSQN
jgi:hypothetical protein